MDTSAGKICVVRCIHEEDRKAWIQMSKKTHTNPLSKQEIEKLRKNPYVASVTTNTVRFTEAFKEQADEKKRQGIPVMETMRQCGIDPEILGASRVEGLSLSLDQVGSPRLRILASLQQRAKIRIGCSVRTS